MLYIAYGLASATKTCAPTRAPSRAPSAPIITPDRAPSAPGLSPVSKGSIQKPTNKPFSPSGTWQTMTTPFTTNFAKPLITDGSVMIIQKQPYTVKVGRDLETCCSYRRESCYCRWGLWCIKTTKAAIYDQLKYSYGRLLYLPPPYCQDIGDSPSLLLADGCWMVSRLLAVQRWSYLG